MGFLLRWSRGTSRSLVLSLPGQRACPGFRSRNQGGVSIRAGAKRERGHGLPEPLEEKAVPEVFPQPATAPHGHRLRRQRFLERRWGPSTQAGDPPDFPVTRRISLGHKVLPDHFSPKPGCCVAQGCGLQHHTPGSCCVAPPEPASPAPNTRWEPSSAS